MSMTIFVVESSSGSYEDYRTVIEKAFYKREDAEDFISKYDAFMREELPEEPVVKDEEFMTSEEYDIWDAWFTKKCEQDQYGGCHIRETELI